jgi:hypothetical protein
MPVSESEQTFPSGVAPKKQKLGFTTNQQSCKCLLVNLSVYFSFVFTSFAIPYDVAADVNCFGSNMDFRNFSFTSFFLFTTFAKFDAVRLFFLWSIHSWESN